MAIKCIETGEIFATAAQAARHVGISPGAMVHHLKGRQKTAGGKTWEKIKRYVPRERKREGLLYDNAGNVYSTYADLSAAKGISKQKAHRWITTSPDRVFQNEWVRPSATRVTFGPMSVNGTVFPTRNEAVKCVRRLIPTFPLMKAHIALDKAARSRKDVTMVFGKGEWVEAHNDLFGEIQ